MKTKARKIKEQEKEIARLKAQVEELLPHKRVRDRANESKRLLYEKRKQLLLYFGYKNYYGTNPRYWPEVLCCDCSNSAPDGRAGRSKTTAKKLKCKMLGVRVGKFGSCNQRKMKQ